MPYKHVNNKDGHKKKVTVIKRASKGHPPDEKKSLLRRFLERLLGKLQTSKEVDTTGPFAPK